MRYLENPNRYEHFAESSLLSYPKKRELPKVAKDVFSRLFHCRDLIDGRAENVENDVTEGPSTKKSKTEELNDILCQPEDQDKGCFEENVLTHIKT